MVGSSFFFSKRTWTYLDKTKTPVINVNLCLTTWWKSSFRASNKSKVKTYTSVSQRQVRWMDPIYWPRNYWSRYTDRVAPDLLFSRPDMRKGLANWAYVSGRSHFAPSHKLPATPPTQVPKVGKLARGSEGAPREMVPSRKETNSTLRETTRMP